MDFHSKLVWYTYAWFLMKINIKENSKTTMQINILKKKFLKD